MSTTVFPVTDQTATAALWQAMASNIDRGTTDPLAGFVDTDQDSVRLQYYGTTTDSGQTSGTSDYEAIGDVDVDLGQTWYYESEVAVTLVGTGGGGDRWGFRVTAPAGVHVYGVVYGTNSGQPTTGNFDSFDVTGTSLYFRCGDTNSGGLSNEPVKLFFVVVGDTGGGNVTFEIVKQDDASADNMKAGPRFFLGRRIY